MDSTKIISDSRIGNMTSQKTVGMDMSAPYGVYVDGEKVAEYADIAEANKHYVSLARR